MMQNMKSLLIIIILLVMILVSDIKESFEDFIKIKVAIVIITKRGVERWDNERIQWKKYMNKYKNVDCYFIECDETENFSTIYSKCKENPVPGMYQKTILRCARPKLGKMRILGRGQPLKKSSFFGTQI